VSHRDYFIESSPTKLSRKIYGDNPFPEAVKVAEYIETRSLETDKIAVLGSEPEIYFYSKRISATGYIYTYGLMEQQRYSLAMQKEMMAEIASSEPRFLIIVNVDKSWLMRAQSEKYIFGRLDDLIHRSYFLVGVVDIVSPDKTIYTWDHDARDYEVQARHHMLVFQRRPSDFELF
jgi:hypothetical protein